MSAARLLRDELHVSEQMAARLGRHAQEASRILDCEVPRSAVVRAAVAAWLDDAEQRPTEVVIQVIRVALLRSIVPLRSYPQSWPAVLAGRLDRLAYDASRILVCKVSRSCVARAAVAAWLDDAERQPPESVSEAIRVAMVRRGRKAQP